MKCGNKLGKITFQYHSSSLDYQRQLNFKSFNIFSGSRCTDKRYRIAIIIGYGVPFAIALLTGIVEAAGSKCCPVRPRFSETSCFFASKYKFWIGNSHLLGLAQSSSRNHFLSFFCCNCSYCLQIFQLFIPLLLSIAEKFFESSIEGIAADLLGPGHWSF